MSELLSIHKVEAYEEANAAYSGNSNSTNQNERTSGVHILQQKEKMNMDITRSSVLLDPCEITIDLVIKQCEYKTDDEFLCSKGILMKEGVAYCPLQEARQITYRSIIASKEK